MVQSVDWSREVGAPLLNKFAAGRVLVFVVAVAVLGAGLVSQQASSPARALSGSEFVAGNIISDSLFYDSQAMSQAEIQSFLQAQVGSCLNGQCLNTLSVPVNSRARITSSSTGNLVCDTFSGGTLSAAAIIYRVQTACGISAKVILVTLQKEQGLVTSRAPSQAALDRAMGMACPDTAPCAPATLGFGNQLYEGAKQLTTYRAARFGRQPGVQSIALNPDPGCGSAVVNVVNYATAALYNYTPYQPNAEALATTTGLGNYCSSYGNRNFWVYYNSWFGSTQGLSTASPDIAPGVLAIDSSGALLSYPGNGKGSWRGPITVGNGWGGMAAAFGVGDFDGDGHRDVIGVTAAGRMSLYPTDGRFGFLTPKTILDGWNTKTAIFSPGDFNGDGNQDIMARDAGGLLWLYPGLGRGKLGAPIQIGNGWGSFTSLLGAGDFNGDGNQDVFARTASGSLIVFLGNGRGSWLGSVVVGNGWQGFSSIVNAGDFNGDGRTDIVTRDGGGNVFLYPESGRTGWLTPSQIGSGWAAFASVLGAGAPAGRIFTDSPGMGDLTRDGARDLLSRDTQGVLWLYPGNGHAGFFARSKVADDWSGMTATLGNTDFNGDGQPDVLATDTAGALWLYGSNGSGGFLPRIQIGNGWLSMAAVIGAGDVDGDGFPDVLAVSTSGIMTLYPGNGQGGFLNSRQVGNGWNVMSAITSVGDFTGDGLPDLIARDSGGTLWLYPGNGSGGWGPRIQIGVGWSGMTTIFSPGDFNGDGNTDVLTRTASGLLYLYAGNGRGGFSSGAQIDSGWQIMNWLG